MKPLTLAAISIAALATIPSQAAEPRNGRQVYESTCVTCHGSGRDGAPRVGDARAWEGLAARGLSSLGKSALEGVRKMPPHGGRIELSDLEVKRAIVHMVNQSGGRWTEPIDREHPPGARPADAIVLEQCSRCHDSGVSGAPRIGDREAWIGRARLGMDGLVKSAIHGHGAMPARGGMADLTDAEVRAAVHYMVQVSLKR